MENQNGKTKVFIKYLCVATIAGVLFTVNIVLKFQPISRSNSCKCSTTVHLYEIKPCLLSLIQRYDTFNVLPADGTDGLRQGLIAAETAAHVSTVQQHAASWVTQAYHAHVLRYIHAVLLLPPPLLVLLCPSVQTPSSCSPAPTAASAGDSTYVPPTSAQPHLPTHKHTPAPSTPPLALPAPAAGSQSRPCSGSTLNHRWVGGSLEGGLCPGWAHPLQSKMRPLSASPPFQVDLWASLRSGTDRSDLWSRNWPGGTSHGQFPFWDPWPPGDEHTHKCLVHTQQVKGHSIHTLVKYTLAVCPERCWQHFSIHYSSLSVTWSIRNHSNMLICCSRNISYC